MKNGGIVNLNYLYTVLRLALFGHDWVATNADLSSSSDFESNA